MRIFNFIQLRAGVRRLCSVLREFSQLERQRREFNQLVDQQVGDLKQQRREFDQLVDQKIDDLQQKQNELQSYLTSLSDRDFINFKKDFLRKYEIYRDHIKHEDSLSSNLV